MKGLEKYFVSFEIAKKLKEIGFDENCFGYYENQDKRLIIKFNNTPLKGEQLKRPSMYETRHNNTELPQWATSAPMYEQVLEWLREKQQLFIDIQTDCTTYPKFAFEIYAFTGNPKDLTEREWGWEDKKDFKWHLYRTYNEALDTAIEQALTYIK